MTEAYIAACCQPRTRLVFDEDGVFRPDLLDLNVAHYCDLIERAATCGAKLVVFPQFGLSGFAPVSTQSWIDASLSFPDEVTRRIGATAKATGSHVVIAATERHHAFPDRYFNSAAVIAPDGEVAMTHRKNYVASTRARPIDVAERFVELFGADAFWPVVDTPLGRIGIALAGEVYWPEATRSLALKGAELIINPTSAPPHYYHEMRPTGALTRPVRAFENQAFLLFANVGAIVGGTDDPDTPWPPSQIFDYDGKSIAEAVTGADCFTTATIDLEALRRARMTPFANFLLHVQPTHADAAAERFRWPANRFLSTPARELTEVRAIEDEVRGAMIDAGRLIPPARTVDE